MTIVEPSIASHTATADGVRPHSSLGAGSVPAAGYDRSARVATRFPEALSERAEPPRPQTITGRQPS